MNRWYSRLENYFAIDLMAFFLGLACAWGLSWTTTDLVWSLWLSSLVVGYLTILSVIGSGVLIGGRVIQHPEFAAGKRGVAVVIGGGGALFLMGFFTLHFCGFHAGHAAFLSSFFPLEGIQGGEFGRAFMNPLLLWQVAITQLLPLYGLFLIPMVFAERHALLKPIADAIALSNKIKNDDSLSPDAAASGVLGSFKASKRPQGGKKTLVSAKGKNSNRMNEAFVGPYRNVIRMHVLIFVFAGLSYFELESFAVFALVYAVYFFPFHRVKEQLSRAGDTAAKIEP